MAEPTTKDGAKEANKAAVDAEAADIVAKGTPALNAALSGGRSTGAVSTEVAHRIAASIARDQDRGISRPLSEHVREANRRR